MKLFFFNSPFLCSSFPSFLHLVPVLLKHADQVHCDISKSKKAIKYKHDACFTPPQSFLLSFDCTFFSFGTYWDACMAKQSCDELLIDDRFINALCCTHTWHFSTLHLRRTDINAFMTFKVVYKLRRGGGPFCFEERWCPGTDSYPENTNMKRKWARLCVWVCMREHTPDFKKCMKNTASFFLNTEKEQTVPRMPGENTVQIVWGRREQIREKAVCSSGLQGNSSTDSQVRQLKEK